MGFLDKHFGKNKNSSSNVKKTKKSYNSVKDYVYNIALFASEKKLSDADKLIEEAKQSFPNSKDEFDYAKKVGIKAQDVSFSYSVSCPKCGTTIKVFTGYCPTCGHQYIQAPKDKWMFDTPQEYVYKLKYYGREGKLEEAAELAVEAKEHFPDHEEEFDNAVLASTLAGAMMKKYQ